MHVQALGGIHLFLRKFSCFICSDIAQRLLCCGVTNFIENVSTHGKSIPVRLCPHVLRKLRNKILLPTVGPVL